MSGADLTAREEAVAAREAAVAAREMAVVTREAAVATREARLVQHSAAHLAAPLTAQAEPGGYRGALELPLPLVAQHVGPVAAPRSIQSYGHASPSLVPSNDIATLRAELAAAEAAAIAARVQRPRMAQATAGGNVDGSPPATARPPQPGSSTASLELPLPLSEAAALPTDDVAGEPR